MRIDVRLHADHYEMRCAECGKLLDVLPNMRSSHFRAADLMDHICPAPVHEAAPHERINPRAGQ
jgi:hypothetical protein